MSQLCISHIYSSNDAQGIRLSFHSAKHCQQLIQITSGINALKFYKSDAYRYRTVMNETLKFYISLRKGLAFICCAVFSLTTEFIHITSIMNSTHMEILFSIEFMQDRLCCLCCCITVI